MQILKKLLTVLLIALMIFGTIACNHEPDEPKDDQTNTDNTGNNNGDDSEDEGDKQPAIKVDYTVTVLSVMGDPVSGVSIFVHEDNGNDYNVCTTPIQTGKDGKAVFKLEEGKLYSVGLVGVPQLYKTKTGETRDERYVLDTRDTTITLELNEDYVPEMYRLGDTMMNFTVTDIDGNTYELYDLLEEKKAVVINFWFAGCGPCQAEFPALNTAYNEYKDILEVLAINDYPYENESHVEGFENKIHLDLNMPLIKENYGSRISLSRFDSTGYPTTVVIDRYGKVVFMHVGAVTSAAKWRELFAFFTADDYISTVVNDIDRIPKN